jgi:hypothetical protein
MQGTDDARLSDFNSPSLIVVSGSIPKSNARHDGDPQREP